VLSCDERTAPSLTQQNPSKIAVRDPILLILQTGLRTLLDDGQCRPKHVTRFLIFKPYVLIVGKKKVE
jgi:hypothetical protein